MKYVLRNYDLYLADLSYDYNDRVLTNLVMNRKYKKIYFDLEYAEEDRKLIFIETGLNLKVEEYKDEE